MKETSYLLGSHNSLTYLRPKKWWMRPFHFMARCQRASYKEQYEKYGVRVFDLRVWFTDNLDEEVRHGVMVFKATNIFIRDFLDYLNDKGDCHLRIILEEDNITKKDKKASMKEDCGRLQQVAGKPGLLISGTASDRQTAYETGRRNGRNS